MKSLKDHGGLGVRDPELVNIALGSKLLWRVVKERKEWWKTAIVKKYNLENRKRSMDLIPPNTLGSPIWKLLRNSILFLQMDLYWIPENGKSINLWKDKILNPNPLEHNEHYEDLKDWLDSH